jgi:hypothetical protein
MSILDLGQAAQSGSSENWDSRQLLTPINTAVSPTSLRGGGMRSGAGDGNRKYRAVASYLVKSGHYDLSRAARAIIV